MSMPPYISRLACALREQLSQLALLFMIVVSIMIISVSSDKVSREHRNHERVHVVIARYNEGRNCHISPRYRIPCTNVGMPCVTILPRCWRWQMLVEKVSCI